MYLWNMKIDDEVFNISDIYISRQTSEDRIS